MFHSYAFALLAQLSSEQDYVTWLCGAIARIPANWMLFVQLANYQKPQAAPSEGGWALLREAQLMTLSLPATGMAKVLRRN